jgi:RNA polymerase-interacting CarD/CdnL/TRCF family regulator
VGSIEFIHFRDTKAVGEKRNCQLSTGAEKAAEPLENDFRLRRKDLKDHLKEGTLTARCEVVWDLTAYGWHKPLNGSIAAFLQSILEILCQEWAAVEKITPEEANTEIQSLLKKGKRANDNN